MSHPIYIDDVSLRGFRDHLIWLVESTWQEVGLTLHTAKKTEDLCYPTRWGEQRTSSPVVAALLWSPKQSCRTSANSLYKMKKVVSQIHQSIKEAYDEELRCKENLERVNVALAQEITSDQHLLLTEKQEQRTQALGDATAQRAIWDRRRREAEENLKDCEAHFARTEVMKFCKNRRYTKTPFNTANALAGLPFIGWRQSVKRCRKWAAQTGFNVERFRVTCRIVKSWNPRVSLKLHASEWLQHGHRYQTTGQTELRKEFFYFGRAIDEVLKTNPRRKLLPYLIMTEYLRRVSTRSPVERLFEEEEQIVVKSKKTRKSEN